MIKKTRKQVKKGNHANNIFQKYALSIYNKIILKFYKIDDIENLKEEGRFEDIFRKYGQKEYKKVLDYARYIELKENKGIIKANIWKMKQAIKKFTLKLALSATIFLAAGISGKSCSTSLEIRDNAVLYEQEIEKYDKKISQYARQINKLNFNDVEIFMKVIYDMWENIQGYGNPKEDIRGFLELDLATSEGYGVCRNMASDIAQKLNAIHPKYNARIMTVVVSDFENYIQANIRKKQVEESTLTSNQNKEQNRAEGEEETGIRHMVTLVDIPEENITLVLDPTNPGIGIYKDGKIIMFNYCQNNKSLYIPQGFRTAVLYEGGISGFYRVIDDYLKSFQKSNLTLEELEEKYGLEAQNVALEKVKCMDTKNNQYTSFDNQLKVGELTQQKQLQNSKKYKRVKAKQTDEKNIEFENVRR